MTIEEKLQHFYTASIDSAMQEAQQVQTQHQEALDKIFQFLNNIYLISGVCLLFCKILRFDMTESRPLLIKFAYITFAALILMFPPCMKKRIQEKEQPALLPTSLAVGFVLILMEFGFVMYAVW